MFQAGENMLKKIISLLLMAVTLFAFTSCAGGGAYIKLGGEKVPKGVYNYYYDKADENEARAVESCKIYLALQELMSKEGVSLSTNYKRLVAEDTEKLWSMFSSHYRENDITKQDITLIKTFDYGKKQLLEHYYASGGKNEVSLKQLREAFNKQYVIFRAVEDSFIKTTDTLEAVEMSEGEKKALRRTFEAMAERVNGGADIDSVNEDYNKEKGLVVTQSLSLNVVEKDSVLYSDSFFSQVSALKFGQAAVIESESNIYMLQRESPDNNEEAFTLYADKVLEGLRMSHIDKKLKKLAEGYE